MSSSNSGNATTAGVLGFGAGSSSLTLTAGNLNTASTNNYAFSMPRAGTITSLSAYFSTSSLLTLTGTTVTVTARLFASATPDNTFSPVPGAIVTFTALTESVPAGTSRNGITTGLNIAVTPQTRLLLVYTCAASGTSPSQTITGYASGGVAIS